MSPTTIVIIASTPATEKIFATLRSMMTTSAITPAKPPSLTFAAKSALTDCVS